MKGIHTLIHSHHFPISSFDGEKQRETRCILSPSGPELLVQKASRMHAFTWRIKTVPLIYFSLPTAIVVRNIERQHRKAKLLLLTLQLATTLQLGTKLHTLHLLSHCGYTQYRLQLCAPRILSSWYASVSFQPSLCFCLSVSFPVITLSLIKQLPNLSNSFYHNS